ncbi:hypothetical protein [Stenotrophomonas cyclobalanopsidis]|uniref:hypothetical protein n=1 Tax=Stenotrophomonas cyclobalanopsidis TaxID=2771362 RepID=UPI0028AFE515|nr:hypothetical protein [Stenotrophomonas cyclobalanopsidis]
MKRVAGKIVDPIRRVTLAVGADTFTTELLRENAERWHVLLVSVRGKGERRVEGIEARSCLEALQLSERIALELVAAAD